MVMELFDKLVQLLGPCRMDLADVMKKNQCDITVHAYYGTEEAKKCISQFLIEQGYDEAKVSFQYCDHL